MRNQYQIDFLWHLPQKVLSPRQHSLVFAALSLVFKLAVICTRAHQHRTAPLLHALPLMLFGAALLPESYFASRSYFTSSMLLLVTLSISVAWLLYAMTLAPMASNVKARAPPLRGGISQDLEVEFQAWKSSTFAQLQMVVVLVPQGQVQLGHAAAGETPIR